MARRGDRPIAVLAQRLQISESCLRRWMDQADIDENGSDSRLTSAEKRELAQLRRETRRLAMENEILKHALAYFAREKRESIFGESVSVRSATEEPDGVKIDTAAGY
jgi:transposase-like protein